MCYLKPWISNSFSFNKITQYIINMYPTIRFQYFNILGKRIDVEIFDKCIFSGPLPEPLYLSKTNQ